MPLGAKTWKQDSPRSRHSSLNDQPIRPFAFSSAGLQNAGEFARNAARTVKDGNLPADVALRALTIDAARIAGADARLGTIERGKIANLVVTEGDLLDNGRIRHVFIDGRPVNVEAPPPATTGRGGRGGR